MPKYTVYKPSVTGNERLEIYGPSGIQTTCFFAVCASCVYFTLVLHLALVKKETRQYEKKKPQENVVRLTTAPVVAPAMKNE